MNKREELARQAFKEGYNCSQAMVAAFSDLMGMDKKTALRLASSFGGGMGRMREVCGAVTGMFMVVGILYGYDLSLIHIWLRQRHLNSAKTYGKVKLTRAVTVQLLQV